MKKQILIILIPTSRSVNDLKHLMHLPSLCSAPKSLKINRLYIAVHFDLMLKKKSDPNMNYIKPDDCRFVVIGVVLPQLNGGFRETLATLLTLVSIQIGTDGGCSRHSGTIGTGFCSFVNYFFVSDLSSHIGIISISQLCPDSL